ncbi:uncharacterized protein LOC143017208 [Genypterus blacodes]|uniref:uncharacterized protein LOC143017208 n=1 Tax=Genypterus blacodes TaxID=154954 RepID=UPI003F76E825
MTLAPLLFLLLTTQYPESTVTIAVDNSGKNFIVAFPENIAYYHPDISANKLKITSLYPNTVVTIQNNIYAEDVQTLNNGVDFNEDGTLELTKAEFSNSTYRISSNHDILIYAINDKSNSVQTALITPIEKLGTEYAVPPVPVIAGTTEPVGEASTYITERGPFRLIIINADQPNVVTITGTEEKTVPLNPYELTQVWVREKDAISGVTAELPVAVYFGHPCAVRHNCTCGMLFTPLLPAKPDTLTYIIPPELTAATDTVILASEQAALEIKPVSPDSLSMEVSGPAVLYRPGLLLNLIPEQEFGSCYVLEFMAEVDGRALIVVKWRRSWTNDGTVFGHSAPLVSATADFRGCLLSAEVLEIGEVADGWRESLGYCTNKSLDLISMSEADLQSQISKKLSLVLESIAATEVWIGMRRESKTGEWYWVNNDLVNATNWAPEEPGTPQEGNCAMMTLGAEFGWKDEDCCKLAHPVCYKPPMLFKI